MMRDFSFRQHMKYVMWNGTLWLNFLRAAIAGVVWFTFGIITGASVNQGALTILLGFSVMYLIILLPLGLVCSLLSDAGVPLTGLIASICAVSVVVADPIVFILHKIKPEIVPVKDYGFINFLLVIFVVDEERLKVA